MPVLMTESVKTSDDRAVLMVLERDASADERPLTSALSAVLSPESTTANAAVDALNPVDNDATAPIIVLISVLSAVLIPESTMANEAAEALSAEDRDVAAPLLALISVLSAALSSASFALSADAESLKPVDSDVTAEFRKLISDEMELIKIGFPLMTVDANDGSFPMAVASSDNVFSVEDSVSPARFATSVLTNGSVAMTLSLYLGRSVNSHWPLVVTLPPENVMLPETSNRFATLGFCMTADEMTPSVTLAVAMIAVSIMATGMMAVPVNVASLMGAFNKFNESSAFLRFTISLFNTAAKSERWDTTSEFVTFPITMLVTNVQL
jgi:hypothetical protein